MDCEKNDFLGIENASELKERGLKLLSFENLDSTQAEARRYAGENGSTPAVIIANSQTNGRGRLGRSFYSPASSGIYLTLVFDVTDGRAENIAHITSAAAVAVARSIENTVGVRCGIKWVNDIYVGGKKVCGIIAESFCAGDRRLAAVGVGVNLCTREFPDGLSDIAASLTDAAADGTRRQLALALISSVSDAFAGVMAGSAEYIEEYRSRSVVIGREIRFTCGGETYEGTALDIDKNGGLEVRRKDGTHVTLTGGEITVRVKEETR